MAITAVVGMEKRPRFWIILILLPLIMGIYDAPNRPQGIPTHTECVPYSSGAALSIHQWKKSTHTHTNTHTRTTSHTYHIAARIDTSRHHDTQLITHKQQMSHTHAHTHTQWHALIVKTAGLWSSQIAEPLWIDLGKLHLNKKKRKKSEGREWMVEQSPKTLASEEKATTTMVQFYTSERLPGPMLGTARLAAGRYW